MGCKPGKLSKVIVPESVCLVCCDPLYVNITETVSNIRFVVLEFFIMRFNVKSPGCGVGVGVGVGVGALDLEIVGVTVTYTFDVWVIYGVGVGVITIR